jgi:hypothetical protein
MKHQRRHTVDLSGAGLLPSKVSMSIQRCSSHWHTGHPTAIGKPKRAASGLDCGQQCSAKKCKLSNRSMPAAPLVSVSASAAETLPDRAYQTFCVKEALCHNVSYTSIVIGKGYHSCLKQPQRALVTEVKLMGPMQHFWL